MPCSVLFIGGPLDGKLLQADKDEPEPLYECKVPEKISWTPPDIDMAFPIITNRIQYRLNLFGTGHWIYAPSWMKPREIMQTLITAYIRK